MEGLNDGVSVGIGDGEMVGTELGAVDGEVLGTFIGEKLGAFVGVAVGSCVGSGLGEYVGLTLGNLVGSKLGCIVGDNVVLEQLKSLRLSIEHSSVSVSICALQKHVMYSDFRENAHKNILSSHKADVQMNNLTFSAKTLLPIGINPLCNFFAVSVNPTA